MDLFLFSGVLTGNSWHCEADFCQIKFQHAGGEHTLLRFFFFFFFVLRWREGQWRHVMNVDNYI